MLTGRNTESITNVLGMLEDTLTSPCIFPLKGLVDIENTALEDEFKSVKVVKSLGNAL